MRTKTYIINEMRLTLEHIKKSSSKFDNKYSITLDIDLMLFVIKIKGDLDKNLKQGIQSKFNKLLIYKGISVNYVFIFNSEEEEWDRKK